MAALQKGILLAYGVHCEVKVTKTKKAILVLIIFLCLESAWAAVFVDEQLESALKNLAIGHASGGCFGDVGNFTNDTTLFAHFNPGNPSMSFTVSTSTWRDYFIAYGSAFIIYIPVILAFKNALLSPYAMLDADEIFKVDGEEELSVARIVEENIHYRLPDDLIAKAVAEIALGQPTLAWYYHLLTLSAGAEESELADKKEKNNVKFTHPPLALFLIRWANKDTPSDIAIVQRVIAHALKLLDERENGSSSSLKTVDNSGQALDETKTIQMVSDEGEPPAAA